MNIHVGNVVGCKIFKLHGLSIGEGSLEFVKSEEAQIALQKMQRYELAGQKMKVSLDSSGMLTTNANKSTGVTKEEESPNELVSLMDLTCQRVDKQDNPSDLNQEADPQRMSNKVFVWNIDFDVSKQQLEQFFSKYGKPIRVDLYENSNGKSKGRALVEYETELDGLNAIVMLNNRMLGKREIRVKFDQKKCEDSASNRLSNDPETKLYLPLGLKSIGKQINHIHASKIESEYNAASVAPGTSMSQYAPLTTKSRLPYGLKSIGKQINEIYTSETEIKHFCINSNSTTPITPLMSKSPLEIFSQNKFSKTLC